MRRIFFTILVMLFAPIAMAADIKGGQLRVIDFVTTGTTVYLDVDTAGTTVSTSLNLPYATASTLPVLNSSKRLVSLANGTAFQLLRMNSGANGLEYATPNINDFDASAGTFSIDYTNGQAASGSNKGFLNSSDWTTFNGKVDAARTISTTSPLSGGGDLSANRTIAIADAAADGSTKGAASFTAADFNASSGNIAIDYTNGQAAATGVKGFLTGTDWDTFNAKVGTARTISTTSPLSGGGDLSSNRTIAIADAAADGSTKGAASFAAIDFDASSANITLDRTATLAGNPALAASNAAFATTGVIFEGSTADTIETLVAVTDPTASDKTITLPNATGTVAVSASSPMALSALGDISIPTASAVQTGALSLTDWGTFNGKYGSGATPSFSTTTINGVALGTTFVTLITAATNDDPQDNFFHQRASCTANNQTLATVACASSSYVYVIEADIRGRCTSGGDALTTGDGFHYKIEGTFKNVAGTVTQVGSTTEVAVHESVNITNANFSISGTNVLVRVSQGGLSDTVVYHGLLHTSLIGS